MKYLKFAMFGLVLVSLNAFAVTAFYSHEEISGIYKTCYYTVVGGHVTTTVRAHELCPASIEV